ncbi:MAG: pentapeptide repeat-containing protein [Nostoc sp. DcaGUA01]|nr:pentapeptide repeat-containing protein [Nostoc sp. DcaGUA01]
MHKNKNAEDKNFDYLNLEGINLQEADLQGASFIGANLKDADLRKAKLSDAKLIETNLDGTNLNEAILTGACIQNCKITAATKRDNIECDYLYLRQETLGDPNRLRQPKTGNLSQEELKKLLTPPEEEFTELYQTFAELYVLKDKVIREVRLIKAAEKANISLDSYRQMFKDYCQQKIDAEWQQSPWLSILASIERRIEYLNHQISQMDILPVLDNLGKLSILVAVILYINDTLQDKVEPKYRAWEIINTGKEEIKSGNNLALEDLVKQGVNLRNIKASGVDLSNINLSNADLTEADLSGAILKNANLINAKLKGAKLKKANLTSVQFGQKTSLGKSNIPFINTNWLAWNIKGADLTKADLTEADLTKADLTDVKLINADLRGANLLLAVVNEKTDLTDACYNQATQLPKNVDPEARKMREVNNPEDKCEKNPFL